MSLFALSKRLKAFKVLGVLLAFLIILPVLSLFGEVFEIFYQFLASFLGSFFTPDLTLNATTNLNTENLTEISTIKENLSHFFEFLFLRFIKDTFIVLFFTLLICFILGVGTAYLVANFNFYARTVLEKLLILPLAIPAYILAFVYVGIMDFGGVFESVFGFRIDLFNTAGVIFVLSFSLYPYVYLFAKTAFASEAKTPFEVGKICGYSEWQIFYKVSLRTAKVSIFAGLMLVLMETLSDYGASAYLGVDTFSAGIFKLWYDLSDIYSSSVLSAFLMLFVFILMALEHRQKQQISFNQDTSQPLKRRNLSPAKALLASLFCALISVLGFILPFLWLLYWGFKDSKLFESDFYILSFHSLALAFVVTLITAVLAFILCFIARINKSSQFSFWLLKTSSIGYAIPGAAIGVSLMIAAVFISNLLDTPLLGTSFSVLIFAYMVRFLATAIYAFEGGFSKIHSSLDEASLTLRKSFSNLAWRVHLPLLKPFFLLAFLVVFIDTIKELPLTRMLAPFSFETLSTKAFWLASDERIYECALPSLMIVLLSLLALFFTQGFLKERYARN